VDSIHRKGMTVTAANAVIAKYITIRPAAFFIGGIRFFLVIV
jgi:hypothetical protein